MKPARPESSAEPAARPASGAGRWILLALGAAFLLVQLYGLYAPAQPDGPDGLLDLLDKGAVDSAVTALALGGAELYARSAADPRVRWAGVDVTHDIGVLAAIPRFVAVNSALEVDLYGQANAEFAGDRTVSGLGGLPDFLRGAQLSDGGVPIIALPSTGPKGVSRIVPRLNVPSVSIPRNDVGVVITEHGSADLRGRDLDARAEALIAIAAPQHRDALANAWAEARRPR